VSRRTSSMACFSMSISSLSFSIRLGMRVA
jgi:hypothetical protein